MEANYACYLGFIMTYLNTFNDCSLIVFVGNNQQIISKVNVAVHVYLSVLYGYS